MRILYLCPRVPFPPDRGDRIMVYHQIRRMARDHEVTVGSLAQSGTRTNAEMLTRESGIGIFAPDHTRWHQLTGMATAFFRGLPITLGYFYNPRLRQWVDAELAKKSFAAIIIHSSSMAQYVEHVAGVPRIMNYSDVDSQKWESMADNASGLKRWIYRRESRTLLSHERKIAEAFEASCVISRNEADIFRQHIPGVPVHIIENGVDVDYFSEFLARPEGQNIVFVGVMDYAPNVEAVEFFARQVFGAVREIYPTACFKIVGSHPVKSVRDLGKIPGVEVTGYVPDVRPYLATATLSVVPLGVARGLQNKVLESMAAGVPVLTTPRVAKGLPEGAESIVFTAEREAGTFTAALCDLLKNETVLREHAFTGQEFVRQNCTWDAKLRALDALLAQVTR